MHEEQAYIADAVKWLVMQEGFRFLFIQVHGLRHYNHTSFQNFLTTFPKGNATERIFPAVSAQNCESDYLSPIHRRGLHERSVTSIQHTFLYHHIFGSN
jgi:hypothetical protein